MDPKYKYLKAAAGTPLPPCFETQFDILICKTGVIKQLALEDKVFESENYYAALEH